MKKLKIALAAVALTVVVGSAYANQATQKADICTPQQIDTCTGTFDVCCELLDGQLFREVNEL